MIKKVLIVTLCILLSGNGQNFLFAQSKGTEDNNPKMEWWKEARFGLFVHWGLYSVAGGVWNGKHAKGNEHFMLYERIPLKEYATLADQFNPTKFNSDEWVKAAKEAGMKYIVITSKHHEGFAMYNSASINYNIVKLTPYHKDPMKALAESCRKYGLKLCFYYSLGRDWEDPDVPTNWPTKGGRSNTWDYPNEDAKVFHQYFERKVKPQITELLTQYGQIGVMWFDTPERISLEESKELRALILQLQPKCIINERIGNDQGDFKVSEQKLSASNSSSNPWESCITISGSWGYNRFDSAFKSPEVLVRNLIEVASSNGNFLLNVGPTGEGEIPQKAFDRLKAVGKWMATNGEAIYGTHSWSVQGENIITVKEIQSKTISANNMKDVLNDATSQKVHQDILYTAKGDYLYLFARSWTDPEVISKSLSGSKVKVKKIQLLGYNGKVSWNQDKEVLKIKLPSEFKQEIPIYTFKITLNKG